MANSGASAIVSSNSYADEPSRLVYQQISLAVWRQSEKTANRYHLTSTDQIDMGLAYAIYGWRLCLTAR